MEIRVRRRPWWAGAAAGMLAAAGAVLVAGMVWMNVVRGPAGAGGSLFELAKDNTAHVTELDCPDAEYGVSVRLPKDAGDLLVVDMVAVEAQGESAL